jgi:hypothetical protein
MKKLVFITIVLMLLCMSCESLKVSTGTYWVCDDSIIKQKSDFILNCIKSSPDSYYIVSDCEDSANRVFCKRDTQLYFAHVYSGNPPNWIPCGKAVTTEEKMVCEESK